MVQGTRARFCRNIANRSRRRPSISPQEQLLCLHPRQGTVLLDTLHDASWWPEFRSRKKFRHLQHFFFLQNRRCSIINLYLFPVGSQFEPQWSYRLSWRKYSFFSGSVSSDRSSYGLFFCYSRFRLKSAAAVQLSPDVTTSACLGKGLRLLVLQAPYRNETDISFPRKIEKNRTWKAHNLTRKFMCNIMVQCSSLYLLMLMKFLDS